MKLDGTRIYLRRRSSFGEYLYIRIKMTQDKHLKHKEKTSVSEGEVAKEKGKNRNR